jgi:hypothetical protein
MLQTTEITQFIFGRPLRPHAGFFDQAAFEQFMTVRYRMREDDVPHEDIFGW